MVFKPQCDRAGHISNGGKMLAQAVVQILADAALFTVTDGEDLAFQSARTIFQKSLSFFLVADVDNNRNRRLGFAFGVAQWRCNDADPQSSPIFATITLLEQIWLGFTHESATKCLSIDYISVECG